MGGEALFIRQTKFRAERTCPASKDSDFDFVELRRERFLRQHASRPFHSQTLRSQAVSRPSVRADSATS